MNMRFSRNGSVPPKTSRAPDAKAVRKKQKAPEEATC